MTIVGRRRTQRVAEFLTSQKFKSGKSDERSVSALDGGRS